MNVFIRQRRADAALSLVQQSDATHIYAYEIIYALFTYARLQRRLENDFRMSVHSVSQNRWNILADSHVHVIFLTIPSYTNACNPRPPKLTKEGISSK